MSGKNDETRERDDAGRSARLQHHVSRWCATSGPSTNIPSRRQTGQPCAPSSGSVSASTRWLTRRQPHGHRANLTDTGLCMVQREISRCAMQRSPRLAPRGGRAWWRVGSRRSESRVWTTRTPRGRRAPIDLLVQNVLCRLTSSGAAWEGTGLPGRHSDRGPNRLIDDAALWPCCPRG